MTSDSYKALIEPVAAVLRVVPDGGAYGDPYSFAATMRWLDASTVELMGVVRAPKPSEARAIVAALQQAGVKTLVWTHRGPNTRTVRVKLERN